MIKFVNTVFANHIFTKDITFNYTFDKGINLLSDKDNELYKFITLQRPLFASGELYFGDELFYPNSDNHDSLIIIEIKSTSIILSAVFRVNEINKKEKVENIKTKLSVLKEQNANTSEEHINKIKNLSAVLFEEQCLYVIINNELKINQDRQKEIEACDSIFNDFITFKYEKPKAVIKKKVNTSNEDKTLDIIVGTHSDSPSIEQSIDTNDNKKVLYDNDKYEYFDNFLKFPRDKKLIKQTGLFIKENFKTLLFLVVPTLGLGLSSLLIPYYIKSNNTLVNVFLFIGLFFCLIFFYMFEASIFDFLEHKDDAFLNSKYKYSTISSLLTSLVGLSGGFGLFFLLPFIDKNMKISEYTFVMFIPVIVVSLLIFLAPCYINIVIFLDKQVNRFWSFLKNIFLKKGK